MKSPEIQLIARQLLLVYQGQCAQEQNGLTGAVPTAEDLAALADGRLSFTRKQEVYAYLNRSPELFAQWVALVEALSELSPRTQEHKRGWRQMIADAARITVPVWVTSAIALIVLVGALPLMTVNWDESASPLMTISGPLTRAGIDNRLSNLLGKYGETCTAREAININIDSLQRELMAIKKLYLRLGEKAPQGLEEMTGNEFSDSATLCIFLLTLQAEVAEKSVP